MASSEEDLDDLNAFMKKKVAAYDREGFGAACWRRECECGGDT